MFIKLILSFLIKLSKDSLILNNGGSEFHILGPKTFKSLRPYLVVLAIGINKVLVVTRLLILINLDLVL